MADGVDFSNLASRMDDSIVHVEIQPLADYRLEEFCHSDPVIRMDVSEEFLIFWQPLYRIETQYAICFLREIGDFVGCRDTCPTARVTEPLRFR